MGIGMVEDDDRVVHNIKQRICCALLSWSIPSHMDNVSGQWYCVECMDSGALACEPSNDTACVMLVSTLIATIEQ